MASRTRTCRSTVLDQRGYRLADLLPKSGDEALYEYDFANGWQHVLTAQRVAPGNGALTAICLDGARACPPERFGGSHGYARFLSELPHPTTPRFRRLLAERGGLFDPAAFDRERINRRLAHIHCICERSDPCNET